MPTTQQTIKSHQATYLARLRSWCHETPVGPGLVITKNFKDTIQRYFVQTDNPNFTELELHLSNFGEKPDLKTQLKDLAHQLWVAKKSNSSATHPLDGQIAKLTRLIDDLDAVLLPERYNDIFVVYDSPIRLPEQNHYIYELLRTHDEITKAEEPVTTKKLDEEQFTLDLNRASYFIKGQYLGPFKTTEERNTIRDKFLAAADITRLRALHQGIVSDGMSVLMRNYNFMGNPLECVSLRDQSRTLYTLKEDEAGIKCQISYFAHDVDQTSQEVYMIKNHQAIKLSRAELIELSEACPNGNVSDFLIGKGFEPLFTLKMLAVNKLIEQKAQITMILHTQYPEYLVYKGPCPSQKESHLAPEFSPSKARMNLRFEYGRIERDFEKLLKKELLRLHKNEPYEVGTKLQTRRLNLALVELEKIKALPLLQTDLKTQRLKTLNEELIKLKFPISFIKKLNALLNRIRAFLGFKKTHVTPLETELTHLFGKKTDLEPEVKHNRMHDSNPLIKPAPLTPPRAYKGYKKKRH